MNISLHIFVTVKLCAHSQQDLNKHHFTYQWMTLNGHILYYQNPSQPCCKAGKIQFVYKDQFLRGYLHRALYREERPLNGRR